MAAAQSYGTTIILPVWEEILILRFILIVNYLE